MNRPGALGAAILLVSLAGVGVGAWSMAQRVQRFNQTLPDPPHFVAEEGRESVLRGRKVTLTDETIRDATGEEEPAIRVAYGDSVAHIPVQAPKVKGFRDLSVYDDSFRLLSFAPVKAGQLQTTPFSDENWRAVIVVRDTADGWDEETWGQVRVKDWTFRLYELMPDGSIAGPRRVQFRDRRGRVPAEVYARNDLKKAGRPVPPMTERLTAIEPIEERTWEWQAALFAVPKAQVSRYRFRSDAVAGTSLGEGMGWTLPVAGFSIMGCVAGVILIGMSRTNRTPVSA